MALRFASPDDLFAALVPSTFHDARRHALRDAFDRLPASVDNRPPAVEIDARCLVVTGRRPAVVSACA